MSHWYKGGVLVAPGTPGALASVTTILDVRNKPWLYAWQMNVGPEEAARRLKESQEKGTAVHGMIETFLKDGEFEVEESDPYYPLFAGFMRWYEKTKPTKVQSEVYLESKKHGYCGTADLICQIDGEWWVIDFKTSKHLDDGYELQLAAYAACVPKAKRTGILQLTDEIQRGYRFKETEGDLAIFLAHKAIFDWQESKKVKVDRIEF